ncbi:MAG: A24 family peptidase C-terminal domain-containing protein [Candidatus Hadarchaeales archaeon]
MVIGIEHLPIAVAIVVASISTYTDLRWRIIPNYLTYTAAAFGMVFYAVLGAYRMDIMTCISGGIGFLLALGIGYIIWALGGWAGGDVKMFAAFGALIPYFSPQFSPAPYSVSYPLFAITILLNTGLVALPGLLTYAGICFALGKGAFYKTVRITELEEGMIPAEWIYAKDGKIFRSNSYMLIRVERDETYTNPDRAAGLTLEQIKMLKDLVKEKKIENRLRIKRGVPFGPFLAIGLFISIFYGDIYWKILTLI